MENYSGIWPFSEVGFLLCKWEMNATGIVYMYVPFVAGRLEGHWEWQKVSTLSAYIPDSSSLLCRSRLTGPQTYQTDNDRRPNKWLAGPTQMSP